jgi:hypothetical protein
MAEVLEELVAPSGRFKVEIWSRPGGLFDLVAYRWFAGDRGVSEGYEYDDPAMWIPTAGGGPVITDSLEAARRLAREELARLTADDPGHT